MGSETGITHTYDTTTGEASMVHIHMPADKFYGRRVRIFKAAVGGVIAIAAGIVAIPAAGSVKGILDLRELRHEFAPPLTEDQAKLVEKFRNSVTPDQVLSLASALGEDGVPIEEILPLVDAQINKTAVLQAGEEWRRRASSASSNAFYGASLAIGLAGIFSRMGLGARNVWRDVTQGDEPEENNDVPDSPAADVA